MTDVLRGIAGSSFRLTLFLAIPALSMVSAGRAAEINFETQPVGTVIFDQFAGVEFSSTPSIVNPALPSASGTQALSNADPGEEFNNQPLTVVFFAPQRFVRLAAGLDHSSAAPVQAELRAFDAADNQVDIAGPIALDPGPAAATTVMLVEVPEPTIVRVELAYSGAFVEVIDDLEFDVVGSGTPLDITAPVVSILLPADDADIAGEFFIFEAEIEEDRQLLSASLTIANSAGTDTFALSFGDGPVHTIGPISTGPLTDGANTITLTAEDFAGNIGTDTIRLTRVLTAARLVLPDGPLVIPRTPNSLTIPVSLEESFPGSLAGRDDIMIAVVQPEEVSGQVVIRDFLNQPVPESDLVLRGRNQAPLGPVLVTIQATEIETGRVIDTAAVSASLTPGREIDCGNGEIALYGAIDLVDLTADVNAAIDEDIAGRDDIRALNDMTVLYRDSPFSAGELHVSQDFEAEGSGFTATIKFVGHLRVIQERDRIEFAYAFTSVVVEANLFVPSLIEDKFRSNFTDDFVGPFGDGLGVALTERINEEVPLGVFLLRDIYINDAEFGLGFCIPRSQFPQVNSFSTTRIYAPGPLAMALFPARPVVAAPPPAAAPPAAAPVPLCGAGALGMVPFLFLGLGSIKVVRRANVRLSAMSGALMLMLALGFGCTNDPVTNIDDDLVTNIDDDLVADVDDDPVADPDEDPDADASDDPATDADGSPTPVADAGEDQATTGDSVQLDGSASFDPDGNRLDFLWTQVSGTPVALVQADSAIAGFEAPDVSDMLVFQLTVDNGQAQSTDRVTVIVEGVPDAETSAERVVTRLESIEDPAARATAAVYTFNYLRTIDRLSGGTVEGRVETALAGYFAGLSPEVRAELQQLGDTLDAIPAATRLDLLGQFGKYDPASTGAPNWDAIAKSVLKSHRLMPRLRADYCSGNLTYGDGTIADRAITVSSRTLLSSSDPEFGGDVVAAGASPVVLGVEGEFVSARHPSLQATNTTPPGDGISPYGAATNIPCTAGGPECDPNKGFVCGTVFGDTSTPTCIAYPVLQKDHEVVLRGYNFWDIDEARLVFTPLFADDGTEATSIVSFVDAKEPTTGADACPVPTPANPTHNLAHFRVTADEGHFYKLRMYNHNGNFFTQADALDDADARVLHVCYPGSRPNNAPDGTIRDCTLPVGTCPEDGAECAATWGTPPRQFEDCRHLPGEVPVCGETPEWFGSELLREREDDVAFTKDIIVYVLDEEPRYEFTATLQAVECAEETGADFLGSDEPMLIVAGFADALPPGVDADIAAKLDESLDAWRGSDYDSGERKTEIQLLSTVDNLTFENQVLYILVVAEDDGFLGGFLAGAAVIVGAAAIIYLTGGAALWTTALGTAGALAIWGPIMASLGEDDLLGTTAFTAISLNFDERIAATHSPDFLTVSPPLFGALPSLPGGPSEGELPARLIHPFVDYSLGEEPLGAQCNPGACVGGEDCLINQCVESAFIDSTVGVGFRERCEFELGGGHYVIDILWQMRTVP